MSERDLRAGFLAACAAAAVTVLWTFHKPLLSGQAAAFGASLPVKERIRYVPEPHYMVVSSYFSLSRSVGRGIFPAWMPESQGGTPLIGKMLPAPFTPFNLVYYVASERAMPYLLMLSVALKFLAGFLFVWLFARLIGIPDWGAATAAVYFLSLKFFRDLALYGVASSGLCAPLAFLMTELYVRRRDTRILLLLPWALALPFFGGHFETAFMIDVSAGLYFLARLYGGGLVAPERRARHVFLFGAAAAAAGLLAGFNIMAVMEYVELSYNRVWRAFSEFGWHNHVLAKQLTSTDAPTALAGWAGIGMSLWALTRLRAAYAERTLLAPGSLGLQAAAAAGLAIGLGCLSVLGFDLPFSKLLSRGNIGELRAWTADAFAVGLALWAFSRAGRGSPFWALGWLVVVPGLIRLTTPPLTFWLVKLPLFKAFNNAHYHWQWDLAVAALLGKAIADLRELGSASAEERRRCAAACLSVAGVFLAGAALAGPVGRIALSRLPSSVNSRQSDPRSGGIVGPERLQTWRKTATIAGWTAGDAPVSRIDVGVFQGGKPSASVDATAGSRRGGGRISFDAEVPLPDGGEVSVIARVASSDGRERSLIGPVISIFPHATGRKAALLAAGALLVMPALILFAGVGWRAAGAASVLLCASYFPVSAIPREQFPYRLSGLEGLGKEGGNFRIFTLPPDFLHAEYPTVYGMWDIRTGSDNLDLLAMVHYQNLARHFLHNAPAPALGALGLRLLGLAGVKYVLDYPEAPAPPGLVEHSRDENLAVYENPFHRPRARFFARHEHVPVGLRDWLSWRKSNEDLGLLARTLARPDFNLDEVLILHDQPEPSGSSASGPAAASSAVSIVEDRPDKVRLEVEAPRPGFVFLGDNYYPGWKASVNGEPARILRSWITFRAVQVPAGKSEVVFRYAPLHFMLGVPLSAALAALLVFLYARETLAAPAEAVAAAVPAAVAKKKGKKGERVDDGAAMDEWAALVGRYAQGLLLAVLVPAWAFWTLWSAFSHSGGGPARPAAWALLAGAGLFAVKFIGRRRP